MKTVILNEFLCTGTKETANHMSKNRYLLEDVKAAAPAVPKQLELKLELFHYRLSFVEPLNRMLKL